MSAPSRGSCPWLRRAREVIRDLLIATALIWALPLLLGAAAALGSLLARGTLV